MASAIAPDSDVVKRLLASGQTTTLDQVSGRLQALYARCPHDGEPAGVRRLTREHGGAILELTMRCTRCADDFVASPESLYLA